MTNEYAPDTVSPPGETLREILEEWTAQEVRRRCGLQPVHLAKLQSGEARFDDDVIRCLGNLFPDVRASFWRARERAYRAWLEREASYDADR